MKLSVPIFIATLNFTVVFSAPALAANVTELRNKCEQRRDAAPCYDLGFLYLKEKEKAHRNAAVKVFRLACVLQKKKASCTDQEVKTTARAYIGMKKMIVDQKDRIPATTKKSNGVFVRASPKNKPTKSTMPSFSSSSSSSQYEAPPPQPEVARSTEPLGTFESAPQSVPMPAMEPNSLIQTCTPDDPNCAPPPPQ